MQIGAAPVSRREARLVARRVRGSERAGRDDGGRRDLRRRTAVCIALE